MSCSTIALAEVFIVCDGLNIRHRDLRPEGTVDDLGAQGIGHEVVRLQ